MEIHISEGPVLDLESYASIPISFVIRSRMDLDQLWLGEYAEIKIAERMKDYDALEPVSTLPQRFDVSKWLMLSVTLPNDETPKVGGAIVALRTPGLDMLEGREDLAILWDIRVHPVFRGHGVGRKLFNHAKQWAKRHGCSEMRIETQDVNVDACRFYRSLGCRIHTIHENAYEGLDEAKIVWTTRV